jgi:16S rRNA (cytosine967-C5)-methyltransferase
MSTDPRSVVTQRISAQFKRFPNIEATPLLVDALDGRDAGLARAIDHAIHRRWYSLSTVIAQASSRNLHNLDASVGATLLVGAAQLLLLDRIPDHAVIHNAVEWIKSSGNQPRAAGFVNAVLRKITRFRGELVNKGVVGNPHHFLKGDGSAWELTLPIFEGDIATQTGFQTKAWKRLTEEHGNERAIEIAINSLAEPPIIVTSSSNTTLPDEVVPHAIDGFGVVPSEVDLNSLFDVNPTLRVQDPTSAASLSLASSLQPRRILDLCAGRGTKTKQLRSMFPDAMIGATEPNLMRRTSLLECADEFNIEVYTPDTPGPTEPFDFILVDAPCSNSGVFARRPEAKYRYNTKTINSVVELQKTILIEACEVLQTRGHLLYATCSIEDIENEGQAHWLTTKQKLYGCDQIRTLPSGQPGSEPTAWHDGGYATLLQAT